MLSLWVNMTEILIIGQIYTISLQVGGQIRQLIFLVLTVTLLAGLPSSAWANTDKTGNDRYGTIVVPVASSRDNDFFISPKQTEDTASEDEPYSCYFGVVGPPGTKLLGTYMETDHGWLTWDNRSLRLNGFPSNKDVGTTSVHIWAIGKAGERDDLYFNITVVNTNPRIMTSPVTYARIGHDYRVNYTSDELDGHVSWSLTTYAKFLTINASTGVLNGTPTATDGGVYDVKVNVEDGNGGWDATNFVLLVDTESSPPAMIDLFSPSQGSDVKNNVMLSLTVNDNWGPVDILEERLDDQSWTLLMDHGTHYSLSALLKALIPGPHKIELKAWSSLGHWSYSSVTFNVFNTPPTLDIFSPADKSLLRGNVTVEGYVTDPDEAISNVDVFVNGTIVAAPSPTANGNWETTIDLDKYPTGPLTISAETMDHWGGVARKQIRITKWTNVAPPIIKIQTPARGSIIGENYSVVVSVDYAEQTELHLEIYGFCNDIEQNVTRGNWSFTSNDCAHFTGYFSFAVRAKVTDRWNQSSEDTIVLIYKGNLTDEMYKAPKTKKSVWPSITLSFAEEYGLTMSIIFGVLAGVHYHFHRKKQEEIAKDLNGLPIESPKMSRPLAVKPYWNVDKAVTYFICVFLLVLSIFSCNVSENRGQTTQNQSMPSDEPVIEPAAYWNVRTFMDKYDDLYVFWETFAGSNEYRSYPYPSGGSYRDGMNVKTLHFSKFSDGNAILVDDKILYPPGVVYSPEKDILPAEGAEGQWTYDYADVWVNNTGDIHLTSDTYWRFDPLGNMVEHERAYSIVSITRGAVIKVDGENRIVNATEGFNIGQDVVYLPDDGHLVGYTNVSHLKGISFVPDKIGLQGVVLRVLYHEPTDRMFVVLSDNGRVCYGEYDRNTFTLVSEGCSPLIYFNGPSPEPFINIDRDGTVHYLVPTLYRFEEKGNIFWQNTSRPEPGLLYLSTKDGFNQVRIIPWDVNHTQVVGARMDAAGNMDIVYKAGYTYDKKYSVELFYKRIPKGGKNDPREQGTRMTPNNDVVIRAPPPHSDCGDIILLITTPATIAYYAKRRRGRSGKYGPDSDVH